MVNNSKLDAVELISIEENVAVEEEVQDAKATSEVLKDLVEEIFDDTSVSEDANDTVKEEKREVHEIDVVVKNDAVVRIDAEDRIKDIFTVEEIVNLLVVSNSAFYPDDDPKNAKTKSIIEET